MPIGDMFKNYPSSVDSVPNLNPTQMALQNKVIGSAGNMLNQSNQYKFNFAPIEQKAREDFQKRTVPSLAERFVGGGMRGSAFQGALGSAASDLETNLASLGAEYGLRNQAQQQGHLSNLLGYGLQPNSENFYTPPQEGPGKQLVDAAGNIIGGLGAQAIRSGTAGQGLQKVGAALGIGGGAAAAASPLLPIMGGLAGASLLGYGIYRIVKRIKAKRQNKRESQAAQQELAKYEQYANANPQEVGAGFPKRGRKETLEAWAQRVNAYIETKARSQGINNLDQLIAEAA